MIEHNITQTIYFIEKIVPINLIHDSFWIQCIHFLQDWNLRMSMQVIIEFKNPFRIFIMVYDEVKSRPWINKIIEFSARSVLMGSNNQFQNHKFSILTKTFDTIFFNLLKWF